MKKLKVALTITLFLFTNSCKKAILLPNSCKDDVVLKTSSCNLSDCGGNGEYCTFGYKWGKDNPFQNAGLEKPGPSTGKIQITYSFQDAGYNFNTHSQTNCTCVSFDNLASCAKQQTRNAFSEWEAVTAIEFIEKQPNQKADIRILAAVIEQGGLGYPAFDAPPCNEMSGLLVLNPNSKLSCDAYYGLVLHEIGHTLGLGHVSTSNIMNPDKYKDFEKLQSGDKMGVQTIYGKKS
jgi:hypothetical protein